MKKERIAIIILAAAIFIEAFLFSSGLLEELTDSAILATSMVSYALKAKIKTRLVSHVTAFSVFEDRPKYHFILPNEEHSISYVLNNITLKTFFPILENALFNSIFQPVFLCIFTPQVVLTYILFPFFLYGCFKYYRKVPIMIIFFIAYCVYMGLRQPVVEALIRHRLSCELIYISISLAGFFRLIERRSL